MKFALILFTSIFLYGLNVIIVSEAAPSRTNGHSKQLPGEFETSYWIKNAQEFVEEQVVKKKNFNRAKNVIIFMGSGMSMTTQAVTRPYIGGEESFLSFERFPSVGMAKTYCVDQQTSDSACTATALLTGAKSNAGTVGVTASVAKDTCFVDAQDRLSSIAKWAMDAGRVAGFVTTSTVTDAGPANLYANVANSDWHTDADVNIGLCPGVDDIAKQLILSEIGAGLRVIMGGGRSKLRHSGQRDEESDMMGLREDGRDLVQEWLQTKQNGQYVWNVTELLNVDTQNVDFLLGLFEPLKMKYHMDVAETVAENVEPSLLQMTEKAIDILSKNEGGFFLFVESGLIDDAHQNGYSRLALDETAELSKTISMVRERLSSENTLIVATADHSHTLTYNGYPVRNNDIFGMADYGEWSLDELPYMTLSYANGPGFLNHINVTGDGKRINPLSIDTSGIRFQFPATVPKEIETNGGDDVSVYASGPWSHLFVGSYEQSVIPYMIAYAACMGDDELLSACK